MKRVIVDNRHSPDFLPEKLLPNEHSPALPFANGCMANYQEKTLVHVESGVSDSFKNAHKLRIAVFNAGFIDGLDPLGKCEYCGRIGYLDNFCGCKEKQEQRTGDYKGGAYE